MGKLNKPARTCSFTFHQLYPYQKLPVLAKDYRAAMPMRAQQHCPPFRAPLGEGCYFYSPIPFEFKVESDVMHVRTQRSDGGYFTTTVVHQAAKKASQTDSRWSTVHAKDIGKDVHREVFRRHKELVRNKGFTEKLGTTALLSLGSEKDSVGFVIQVWLGGIVALDPGDKLLIKAPVNLCRDPGFDVLDGIIESDRWHGWLGIILQPRRFGEWVAVGVDEPLVQGLVYQFKEVDLETIPVEAVSPTMYTNLLRWHSPSSGYRNPPGKYQRQLQRDEIWTCGEPEESDENEA